MVADGAAPPATVLDLLNGSRNQRKFSLKVGDVMLLVMPEACDLRLRTARASARS